MNSKTEAVFYKIGYALCSLVVMTGAVLRITHYSSGTGWISIGTLAGIFLLVFENTSLRKKIKQLEQEH